MDQKENDLDLEWDEEKVARLWNYYSDRLPAEQYFSFHSGYRILRYVGKWVAFRNLRILDFGCGPGYMIRHLLELGGDSKIYGLDFSPVSVAAVNEKFQDHKNFGRAICPGPGASSPSYTVGFDSESMDIVICIEVIEHLNDEQLKFAFGEVHRILKPGGKFIITTPNEENLDANRTICPECGCIFHRWQHVRTWSAKNLGAWLTRFDFKSKVIRATCFQSSKTRLFGICLNIFKLLVGKRKDPSLPHLLAIAEKHV